MRGLLWDGRQLGGGASVQVAGIQDRGPDHSGAPGQSHGNFSEEEITSCLTLGR